MFCCFSTRAVSVNSFEPPPITVPLRTDVKIKEAKESRIRPKQIEEGIVAIHEKELALEKGSEVVRAFLRNKYFGKKPLVNKEKVWIAENGREVIGFIMGRHDYWDIPLNEREGFRGPISNKYRINYLAVDSEHQGKDIGTQLMLRAMKAAKNMGYEYLCVEYLLDGKDIPESSSLRREKFYEQNFYRRFGIISGKEEKDFYDEKGFHHRCIWYNLESFNEERIGLLR